jgi:hypothetical protein
MMSIADEAKAGKLETGMPNMQRSAAGTAAHSLYNAKSLSP